MEEKKRKKFYSERTKKQFKKEDLHMRIKAEDKQLLKEKAAELNMTLSDYVYYKVFEKMDTDFNPSQITQVMKDSANEIKKVGVNINQATNYLNFLRGKEKIDTKAVEEFDDLFYDYNRLLEDLKQELINNLRKLNRKNI